MTNARFTRKIYTCFFSPSPLPTNKQMSPSPQIKTIAMPAVTYVQG